MTVASYASVSEAKKNITNIHISMDMKIATKQNKPKLPRFAMNVIERIVVEMKLKFANIYIGRIIWNEVNRNAIVLLKWIGVSASKSHFTVLNSTITRPSRESINCEIIKLVADINKTSLFFLLKFEVVVSRRTHLVSLQCSINFEK